MFGSAFDFPRFYDTPSQGYYNTPGYYYGYPGEYGRRPQNYPTSRGFGMPHANMSPNMQHRYGIPVEIPVVHEGSNNVSEKSEDESRNLYQPDHKRNPNKDVRETRQQSPKHRHKEQNPSPYPVRQVSMSDMDASDDEEEDFPFYSDLPLFGGRFPFTQRYPRKQPPTKKVTRDRMSPQKNVAETKPKSTNIPPGKASEEPSTGTDRPPSKSSQNYKSRTVPIVMEQMPCQSNEQIQHTKHVPSPMEQLELVKSEMDNIESKIDDFTGEKKDKEYIILDETMTSLLLKLDTIESNGIEEIRNRRRQLVKHVQECVQKLEQKVGILPKETPSVENFETAEEMEDIANEDESTENMETTEETDDRANETEVMEQMDEILPEEETKLATENTESGEVTKDDAIKGEGCSDTEISSLDIPEKDAPACGHHNEESKLTSTLTPLSEATTCSPPQRECELDATAAVNDIPPTETVSENLGDADAERTEQFDSVKETSCDQNETEMDHGDSVDLNVRGLCMTPTES